MDISSDELRQIENRMLMSRPWDAAERIRHPADVSTRRSAMSKLEIPQGGAK